MTCDPSCWPSRAGSCLQRLYSPDPHLISACISTAAVPWAQGCAASTAASHPLIVMFLARSFLTQTPACPAPMWV